MSDEALADPRIPVGSYSGYPDRQPPQRASPHPVRFPRYKRGDPSFRSYENAPDSYNNLKEMTEVPTSCTRYHEYKHSCIRHKQTVAAGSPPLPVPESVSHECAGAPSGL